MAAASSIAIFACVLFCRTKPINTSEASDYIISVIQYLAESEFGVPKCVFFGMPNNHPIDEISEQVIQSPRLDHVTRFVVISSTQTILEDLPDQPLLMMINVGDFFSREPLELAKVIGPLSSADPTTKLLVLIDFRVIVLKTVVKFFKLLAYINVIYLDGMNRQLVKQTVFQLALIPYLSPPQSLYTDNVQNIRGRDITIYTPPPPSIFPNADEMWVMETAAYLNSIVLVCPNHLRQNADLTLRQNRMRSHEVLNRKQFMNLLTAATDTLVILVPQHWMGIVQLFLSPFNWEVWLVIIVVAIVLEGVKLFFPSALKNDPLLLVVCGFERYDLHKADRWEQMLLHSMIIFFFLTSCAYEAKIISLIIHRPTVTAINTIDDLVKFEIKIFHKGEGLKSIVNDTRINRIYVTTNKSWTDWNGINAYIANREMAPFYLQAYHIQTGGRSNYRVLEESFGMFLRVYWFQPRSPLIKPFGHTFQHFFENGMMSYWTSRVEALCRLQGISSFDPSKNAEERVLQLSDMVPAWLALATGLTMGLVVFISESIILFCTKRR